MPIKWIGFIAFVWIVLIILASTFDAQSGSTWGPNQQTALSYLTDVKKIVYAENETGSFAWLTPNPEYFDALYTLVAWKFSFLQCPDTSPGCGYVYFRYIVLVPFSLTAIFGLVYMFIELLWGFLGSIFGR